MTEEVNIKLHDVLEIQAQPEQYLLDLPLQKAVETALRFNKPLLLTGEPGTGKTQLAYKVAHQLHQQTSSVQEPGKVVFDAIPLRFNTKTTSQARDLFYLYDAIGHFQQANLRQGKEQGNGDTNWLKPTAAFIELQALGLAIAKANPKEEYSQKFKFGMPSSASSSVVLIDEVDKAPRDFSNDILNEIENREFFIKEQDNYKLELGKDNPQRILIIMTSNSEKNLPEAFLRRCVFYHIPAPSGDRLRAILKSHLSNLQAPALDQNLDTLAREFEALRRKVARKPPATAELVALVKLLELEGAFSQEGIDVKKAFKENLSLLIKTKEDLEAVREYLGLI